MSSFEENSSSVKAKDMLIGAMLRVPAQAIHRRILRDLNAAGFKRAYPAAHRGVPIPGQPRRDSASAF